MRLNRQYSVLLCAEAEFLLFLRKDMNTIVYLLIVLLEKVTDTQVRIIQNLVYGKKKKYVLMVSKVRWPLHGKGLGRFVPLIKVELQD